MRESATVSFSFFEVLQSLKGNRISGMLDE